MADDRLPRTGLATLDASNVRLVLDGPGMRALTADLVREVRLSGTPEELRAFETAQQFLRGFGVESTLSSHRALIGYPLSGQVSVGSGSWRCNANPSAMATSTPAAGLTAEVIDLGAGTEADYAAVDVTGKMVLCDGLGVPDRHLRGERAGAAGQIYVTGTRFHEMIVSPIWGTATTSTKHLLPSTPSVQILAENAAELRGLLRAGTTAVTLTADSFLEWIDIPMLIADVPGTDEDSFVLLSSHIDSWHYGAIDNGTGNAGTLAITASIAAHKGKLRRGLRLGLWSGHSHGRYAGSTRYLDTHWDDLEARCVAHVNLDGLGSAGSNIYPNIPVMSSAFDLVRDVLDSQLGVTLEPRAVPRAGDHSFMPLGVTAIFNSVSEQPATGDISEAAAEAIMGSGSGGAGLGWFWHSTSDTIDRLGETELIRDTELALAVIARICQEPLLPFKFSRMADDIADVLAAVDPRVAEALNLASVAELVGSARDALLQIENASWAEDQTPHVNDVLRQVGQAMISVVYTAAGRFDQDLALGTPPLPGLADAQRLASLTPGEPEYQYLEVTLLRQRNRLATSLRAVLRLCVDATAVLDA